MSTSPELTSWGGIGWFEVNLAFLIGGLWLLYRRIFTWHAPVAMITALAICALVGFDGGSSESGGSPLFHLFSGATMFSVPSSLFRTRRFHLFPRVFSHARCRMRCLFRFCT